MNNSEIIGNIALVIGSLSFLTACFWTMHSLDKDHKKKPPKHKKAQI